MGFDEARVILDRENHTYYTGETVYGRLVFHLDKVKKFRGLYLNSKGYCDVHWTSERSREVTGPDGTKRTENETVNHSSQETYFEQRTYFVGGASGEHHLNAGSHEFPFQCLIPVHCPSSYENRNGSVRYELRFVVDRPWKFDQEKVVNFNVIARKDLNADPYCKEPAVFDFQESYCCWCMSVGVCKVMARLPASGYCPGQTMRVQLDCDNKSNVEIEEIKMELKEETTFRASHEPDTRREKTTLVMVKKGPIPGNTKRDWIVEIEVPVIDPRNLDACKYIDVDYEFEVTVSPSGCHSSDSASRRIVLGHIPLKDFEGDFNQANNPYVNPVGPPQTIPGNLPPGAIPQPYPGPMPPNPAYPGQNPPFPGPNPAYPSPNPSFPSPNPAYPSPNPAYPGANPPYPGQNPPYPGANVPSPGGNLYPNVPYPAPSPTPGFVVPTSNDGSNVPLIPPGTNSPYSPPPQVNPSVPQPNTPDFYKPPPAFNPDYKEQ